MLCVKCANEFMSAIFAPLNYKAFILCPAKLWSNADFAPQNHRDMVSWAKITKENIFKFDIFPFFYFFCKSMLLQRSIQQLGSVFKKKIFFVTEPVTT